MHIWQTALDPPASRRLHSREHNLRARYEAARRAALTPKERAYEDWSLAWYRNNKHEDREAELDAFEAASTEWNETH